MATASHVEKGNFEYHQAHNPKFDHAPDGRPMMPEKLPVGPDHILYPVLIGLALFPIAMGPVGHGEDAEADPKDYHPFFPDHFWPYPIIMALVMVVVAAAAALLTSSFTLDQPADPRVTPAGGPRPEWYFMFLFQILKMGPELIMAMVIPGIVTGIMVLWPWLDELINSLRTTRYRPPAKNPITGGVGLVWVLWMFGLGITGLIEYSPDATWPLMFSLTAVLLLFVTVIPLWRQWRRHQPELP
ncbi:MAG: hypothetical protein ACYDAY_02235 [Candidatus Dormibacteria bacterium]